MISEEEDRVTAVLMDHGGTPEEIETFLARHLPEVRAELDRQLVELDRWIDECRSEPRAPSPGPTEQIRRNAARKINDAFDWAEQQGDIILSDEGVTGEQAETYLQEHRENVRAARAEMLAALERVIDDPESPSLGLH